MVGRFSGAHGHSDPEGNDVWYLVSWGDKTSTGWIGPYASGEEVTLGHIWNVKGTFNIDVQAEDVFDEKSEVASLQVTMPRNKASTRVLFFGFFERLLNTFLLLTRIR